jgi:hypothetical protein
LKLSEGKKALILKFSDNSPSSTLAKFLDDVDDPDFLAFINQTENENIVKGFVSHKEGVDLSNVTDEVAELTTEQVDKLTLNDKATYWYNRSTRITTNNTKFAKARKFEDQNSAAILAGNDVPCANWGGNGNRKPHS